MSAHSDAIRLGEKANAKLGVLFDKMGGGDKPRTGIVAAYNRARKSLARNLDDANATRAILGQLRRDVSEIASGLVADASTVGHTLARDNAALYGVQLPLAGIADAGLSEAMLTQWLNPLDMQISQIETMALAGLVDPAMILGDASRAGLLSPAPVTRDGARWLTTLVSAIGAKAMAGSTAQPQYRRQAVATIDQFTTDCCLKAHGQVVEYGQPFHLVGTPRFADYMMETPFHWNCRSVTVLIPVESVEDETTVEMRDAAKAEIDARETTGKREEIWPSHARSRRAG